MLVKIAQDGIIISWIMLVKIDLDWIIISWNYSKLVILFLASKYISIFYCKKS